MTLPAPRLVFIDLDGTLVDSVPDLALAVDEMTEALGLPARGEARVREWIGHGVERLVERALVGAMDGKPDEALAARAVGLFLDAYARHNGTRSTLFPGVLEGLEFLRGIAEELVCVTNKPSRFSEPLLRALAIRDAFSLVLSGDSLPRRKPDPMPLLHALRHFAVDARDALLIGDSISDVRAARAARVRVICVGNGYNHGRDIRDAEPDAVVDSMRELNGLITAGGGC